MSTRNTNPQQQNIEELLEMIREIGGTAEAITNPSPTELALLLRELQAKMTTHTLIVGLVPHGRDTHPLPSPSS